MELWRLSRFSDLKGTGGLRFSGRWHTAGHPIVYLAESAPGAILEVLVHLLEDRSIPPDYKLLCVVAPDAAGSTGLMESLQPGQLPSAWRDDITVTQRIGNQWLTEGRSVLLRVPSVLVPATFNVLLNPLHPDAPRMRVAASLPFTWDGRLYAMLDPIGKASHAAKQTPSSP
jgi:RES domain-containing protein